jgi:hypothetical protein
MPLDTSHFKKGGGMSSPTANYSYCPLFKGCGG